MKIKLNKKYIENVKYGLSIQLLILVHYKQK